MRPRATPTRLELHRLKYEHNGRKGHLLPYNMLNEAEKEIIQNEVLQDIRVKRIDFTGPMDKEIFYEVQTEVFAEYGVMCPHADNWQEQADHPKAKRCKACGALLFPDTWRAQLKVKADPESLFPTK